MIQLVIEHDPVTNKTRIAGPADKAQILALLERARVHVLNAVELGEAPKVEIARPGFPNGLPRIK